MNNQFFLLFPQCLLQYKVHESSPEKHLICCLLNSLTDKQILDMTRLKAFADDKLNVARMMISLLDRVEKIVGKRRKCWLPAFSSLWEVFFSKAFLL